MADNRMTFTLVGRDHLSRAFRQAGVASGRLKKDLIGLGIAAALPATAAGAAGALALAGAVASAGTAVAAFGLAVGPQAVAVGKVSEAQKKYKQAVAESGAASAEAVKAQLAYSKSTQGLHPETLKAANGLLVLKDTYKKWSDGLAGDTMPVLTKSFATFSGLLPKLNPLVRGTSTELNRLMTIAGGAVASGGFDRMMEQFSAFSTKTLRNTTDGIVHLSRSLQGFDPQGGRLGDFLAYARENGPLVAGTLRNLGSAVANLLASGSSLGVAMLHVANALARVVNAIPPGALAAFLQLYAAFRLLSLAGAGMAALAVIVRSVGRQLVVMSVAATGATGPLAALRAAFLALSATARGTIVIAAIAALVVVLVKLSNMGKRAPADIDRLTTSLGNLGRTGRVSGEAARAFGKDLSDLGESLRFMTKPGTAEQIEQAVTSFLHFPSKKVRESKKDIDAVDKALANLVKSGNPKLAEAAFQETAKSLGLGKAETKAFRGELGDWGSALADAKFEANLVAESMGLFGHQAQATARKLDGQKASADGLRQAIQALNDVNRLGMGGMIGFEAAIDAAAKAAKENAGSLKMVRGELDLNGSKARASATALQDLAAKTDEAAGAARESGASWETVNGIYARGRQKLIANADAMGLTRAQAERLANQILKIPDKKSTKIEMRREDAIAGLDAVIKKIKATPGAKSITVRTLSSGAIKALEDVGFKVKRLPDGRLTVTAKTGTALSGINAVQRARDRLSSKEITIRTNFVQVTTKLQRTIEKVYKPPKNARGGPIRGYAGGGDVQSYPQGGFVTGPGTGTSDSIMAMFASGAMARISNTEYVVQAAAVRKYGVGFLDRLNAMRLAGGGPVGYASGGAVRKEVSGDLTSLIRSLSKGSSDVSTALKKLMGDLRKLGAGGVRLAGRMEDNTRRMVGLMRANDKLAARMKEAREFAATTTGNALSGAALSSLPGASSPTADRVASGLKSRLAKIRAFSRFISTLAKRGLSKVLLRQIIEMGPEDGYLYAQALASASGSSLREINTAQAGIDKEAKALGRQGADILYDSGKQAGKGFLAGLQAQQKAIEKLMLDIAKGMQKAIRKALGIKSPSAVMASLGAYSTQGLARGLVDGMPALDRALVAVTDRVAATRPTLTPGYARQGGRQGAVAAAAPTTVDRRTYNSTYNLTTRAVTLQELSHMHGEMEARARLLRPR